jgi:sulfur-carrier protein
MSIKVLFFGIISEVANKDNISLSGIKDTDELNNHLKKIYPEIKNYPYRIAVNREMITQNTKLNDGDETALLPPFAGG